jgi:uncharacterized protein YcbK (DUF882 family)
VPRNHVVSLPRRRFLAGAAVVGSAAALGRAAPAAAALRPERALSLYSIHTKEALEIAYWADGRYVKGALAAIDYHLRDFRTDEVHSIDARLLDLVHRLNQRLGNRHPVHVISGYRSPRTNAMLASRSSRVSTTSYHMQGMAIDIRLPGCRLQAVREAALELAGGGVGFYPDERNNFVHLDTGPVRNW